MDRKETNRQQMPTVTRCYDETERTFPGSKVIFAEENGIKLGEAKGVRIKPYIASETKSNKELRR